MELFRQRYRIEPARLQGWDYTAAGWYFVTICAKDRCCYFGKVENDIMRLSVVGEIVAEEWLKAEQVRVGVQLDQWVLMPNHLHGIVIILEGSEPPPAVETPAMGPETPSAMGPETPQRGVSTTKGSRLKPNSLGAIIGQFKSSCTKRIWAAGNSDFSWQSRFYDHIIRDEQSLNNIREYIINNPIKWTLDKDNSENLFL